MSERMLVQVELFWGKKWNGNWYEETPGVGVYASVSEHGTNRMNGGFSFSGCPLGRTDDGVFGSDHEAVEAAIRDFIARGRSEYLGKLPLCRGMVVVAETRDFRKG